MTGAANKKIKLVACDIDGTLLQKGDTGLRPSLFALIHELQRKGVAFCAASGRQYTCLLRMFAPVAGEIYYICENGAAVFDQRQQLLSKTVIPQQDAMTISRQILEAQRCEVLISGERTCYILPKEPDFLPLMRDQTGNDTTVVSSLSQIPEPMIKISAFCRDGVEAWLPEFEQRWGKQYRVAVSGEGWIDFTLADKGAGLEVICRQLQISPQEVMAFGDNFNDIQMLRMAGVPCVMAHAHEQVRRYGQRICSRVEPELERLLREQELS